MNKVLWDKLETIENLKDRAVLKEVLRTVLIPLWEHNEKMYEQLEKRVFDDIHLASQAYPIYTTLVRKKEYDPIHYFLFPMDKMDVEDKVYNLGEIKEKLFEEGRVEVFKIFFQGDYKELYQLLQSSRIFKGTITTKKRVYRAHFTLEIYDEYWERVKELYRIFIDNNIPWRTINIPYIKRMLKVVLRGCEGEISKEEEISKLEVDFGEYSSVIVCDCIPMWNIRELDIEADGFPVPCEDKIYYEHTLDISQEGKEHGYLVKFKSKDIKYVRRIEEGVVVASEQDEATTFNLIKIVRPKEDLTRVGEEYPIFSNNQTSSFTEKLASRTISPVRTKAEMLRLITSYGLEKHINYVDCTLLERHNIVDYDHTYNMNYFIEDEIRVQGECRVLLLRFKATRSQYFLNKDLMSFLVSEVQLYYPEYECKGQLV